MRTLKMILNVRINSDMNVSMQTEVLMDNLEEAEKAGKEAMEFFTNVMKGVGKAEYD